MSLTDWDKVNWLCRPDLNGGDVQKGYSPVPRAKAEPLYKQDATERRTFSMPHNDSSKSDSEKKREGLRKVHWDLVGWRWKEMGWTDEEIEAKFQEW